VKLKLIYNPAAGRGRAKHHAREVEQRLRSLGADVEPYASTSPADLTRSAAESSRAGFDRVVVCGGDGTLNLALRDFDLSRGTLALATRLIMERSCVTVGFNSCPYSRRERLRNSDRTQRAQPHARDLDGGLCDQLGIAGHVLNHVDVTGAHLNEFHAHLQDVVEARRPQIIDRSRAHDEDDGEDRARGRMEGARPASPRWPRSIASTG